MNPYRSPNSEVCPPHGEVRRRSPGFGWFLAANWVGLGAFPIVLLVAAFVAFGSDLGGAAILGGYVAVQGCAAAAGMYRWGYTRWVIGPTTAAAGGILLYNRHWTGQVYNSPFTNGVEIYDQQAHGVFAYYRVFDWPHSEFGPSYFDPAALAMDLELILAVMIVCATCCWIVDLLFFLPRGIRDANRRLVDGGSGTDQRDPGTAGAFRSSDG